MKRLLTALCFIAFATGQLFAQAPSVGGGKVYTKTSSYTVKSTDLGNTLAFNCSTSCTATMPASTSSWPKNIPVKIQNISVTSVPVTIQATGPSTIFGMPTPIVLTAQGNYVELTANTANNYFASGVVGTPIAPVTSVAFMIDGSNCFLVSPGICFLVQ